ncbi:MAG: MFS transporter [Acidobacteriota bacterium]
MRGTAAPPAGSVSRERARALELWGWCLYDFANSAYPTLITTVAYAVYFTQVVAAGKSGPLLWGVAISASMLVVGVVSPLVGAIADFSASKKKWLLLYTLVCVTCTALLFFVGPGDVVAGVSLFVVSNIGFAGAVAVYNGFLPEITDEHNVGRVSGYGYGLGYAGGTLALAACLPLLRGGFGADNAGAFRAAFPLTALFFAVFSVPTFLWLRERATARPRPANVSLARIGYRRLAATWRRVGSARELVKFLAAYVVFNDGVQTVIYFSNIYAVSVLGFSMLEAVMLFMAVQITALGGSIAFGHVADRIGPKPTLVFTLVLWSAVVLAVFEATSKGRFWIIALVAGVGLGSTQASSRGLMRLFVPAGREAEYFGFFAICQKFSALLGPVVYGLVTRLADDQRLGVLSVLAFFAVGLGLLARVDVAGGTRAAKAMCY